MKRNIPFEKFSIIIVLVALFISTTCAISFARRFEDPSYPRSSYHGDMSVREMTHNSEDENWFVGIVFLAIFIYVMYKYAKFMDPSIGWVKALDRMFGKTEESYRKNSHLNYSENEEDQTEKNEYRAKSYDDITNGH